MRQMQKVGHFARATGVPPMFAADEPTSGGPRKDDVPTHDPRDYTDAVKDTPDTSGKGEERAGSGEKKA